jgi:murein DD-endopeptidase MepM/ murein hydrolase activator NlpD
MGKKTTVLLIVVGALALVPTAQATRSSRIAAIQVALWARGLYTQTIDGIRGPATTLAIRRFQQRNRLAVDGIAGPQTLGELGRLGRPFLGSRVLHRRLVGFDVSQLQFRLAWHGFPSGAFDGHFGLRTSSAVRRFQHWSHLLPDGIVGPATLAALRRHVPRAPMTVRRPVRAPVGDGFGPRGNRFHAGLDFTASYGARVRAARRGRVVFAGWNNGGFGYLVKIHHGRWHSATWYAHLSRITVRRGRRVSAGAVIGRVGATGRATGPHLHFQITRRGATVNPLPALR